MKVTIAISFYNPGEYFEDAIRSVFAQTSEDWELLLVDDGSTDGSLQLAQQVSDERVRVFSDGKNLGLAYRLNQIAGLARGAFIARMDADDLMHPNRISEQLAEAEKSEADIIGSDAYSIDIHSNVVGYRRSLQNVSKPAILLEKTLFLHPTVFARRTWFRKNLYDTGFKRAQDRELWCRSFGQYTYSNIPKPLLYYREVGKYSFTRYVEHKYENIMIILRYGRGMAGVVTMLMLMLKEALKVVSYGFYRILGKEDVLVRARSEALPHDSLLNAQQTIDGIRNTKIPGIG